MGDAYPMVSSGQRRKLGGEIWTAKFRRADNVAAQVIREYWFAGLGTDIGCGLYGRHCHQRIRRDPANLDTGLLGTGINWIDTAKSYGQEASEEALGWLLAELPEGERLYVSTKFRLDTARLDDIPG